MTMTTLTTTSKHINFNPRLLLEHIILGLDAQLLITVISIRSLSTPLLTCMQPFLAAVIFAHRADLVARGIQI